MNATMNRLDSILVKLMNQKHLLVPAMLLGLVAVLVVPLPPGMLDVLLAANISLAAVILLTTVYTKSPLDFSVFPALLLMTTLGRLVLNVASTRLILSADATTPEEGSAMAGQVIEAFGTFVAGSSIIVGGIIFLILIVVQFVVVTKGATRMSEVAARFTLDAMPGRQMAIDADLSAGLISEHEATTRRDSVLREADFYGAMDGASKFVRGDAIAGLVIILINIIGGFAVGAIVKGWSISETAMLFTKLTIGDGLASQIPSFLIAIAAGLIVARAGNKTPLGLEIPKQLISQPAALGLVAVFLAILSITPLPTIPLLALATTLGLLSWTAHKKQEIEDIPVTSEVKPTQEERSTNLQSVVELELGVGLLTLASGDREENLIKGMTSLRVATSSDLGFYIPSIRIHDNLALASNQYRIKLRGGIVGEGVIHKNRFMVVKEPNQHEDINGIHENDPVFGLPAVWVTGEVLDQLGELFVQALSPVSVIMTHLSNVTKLYAGELLSREQVSQLIEELGKTSPNLIEQTIENTVTIPRLHRVLTSLLEERVPIMDLTTIIEITADYADFELPECVEKGSLCPSQANLCKCIDE